MLWILYNSKHNMVSYDTWDYFPMKATSFTYDKNHFNVVRTSGPPPLIINTSYIHHTVLVRGYFSSNSLRLDTRISISHITQATYFDIRSDISIIKLQLGPTWKCFFTLKLISDMLLGVVWVAVWESTSTNRNKTVCDIKHLFYYIRFDYIWLTMFEA